MGRRRILTGNIRLGRDDVMISHETAVVAWEEGDLPEMHGPTIVIAVKGHFPDDAKTVSGAWALDAERARGVIAQVYLMFDRAGLDLEELLRGVEEDMRTMRARQVGEAN